MLNNNDGNGIGCDQTAWVKQLNRIFAGYSYLYPSAKAAISRNLGEIDKMGI